MRNKTSRRLSARGANLLLFADEKQEDTENRRPLATRPDPRDPADR